MIKQKILLLVAMFASLATMFGASQVIRMPDGPEAAGYLGVQLRDVTARDVDELGLPREAGAYITEIVAKSPAEKGGLAEKDVIVEYCEMPVLSVRQLQRLVRETPAGREVSLKVVRNRQTLDQAVRLGRQAEVGAVRDFGWRMPELDQFDAFRFRRPDRWGRGEGQYGAVEPPRTALGITGTELTEQMAGFLGIPGEKGVLVLEVRRDSPAEEAGLRAGDVVVSVNGETTSTAREIARTLKDGDNRIEVVRNKKRQTLRATVNAPERQERGERPRKI